MRSILQQLSHRFRVAGHAVLLLVSLSRAFGCPISPPQPTIGSEHGEGQTTGNLGIRLLRRKAPRFHARGHPSHDDASQGLPDTPDRLSDAEWLDAVAQGTAPQGFPVFIPERSSAPAAPKSSRKLRTNKRRSPERTWNQDPVGIKDWDAWRWNVQMTGIGFNALDVENMIDVEPRDDLSGVQEESAVFWDPNFGLLDDGLLTHLAGVDCVEESNN